MAGAARARGYYARERLSSWGRCAPRVSAGARPSGYATRAGCPVPRASASRVARDARGARARCLAGHLREREAHGGRRAAARTRPPPTTYIASIHTLGSNNIYYTIDHATFVCPASALSDSTFAKFSISRAPGRGLASDLVQMLVRTSGGGYTSSRSVLPCNSTRHDAARGLDEPRGYASSMRRGATCT